MNIETDIKNLLNELESLRQVKIKQKEYKKNYFQNIQKDKTIKCDLCNDLIKYGSYSNHLKSKKHKNNLNKKYIE